MSLNTPVASLVLIAASLCSACAPSPQSESPEQEPQQESVSATALVGEWTVESIEGAPVVDESPAFLGFGEDGRVHGNTSVNRLLGSWSLDEGVLQLGGLGSTKMAGPPTLMEQENQLLAALALVTRAEMDDEGRLVLNSADAAPLVVASRRSD